MNKTAITPRRAIGYTPSPSTGWWRRSAVAGLASVAMGLSGMAVTTASADETVVPTVGVEAQGSYETGATTRDEQSADAADYGQATADEANASGGEATAGTDSTDEAPAEDTTEESAPAEESASAEEPAPAEEPAAEETAPVEESAPVEETAPAEEAPVDEAPATEAVDEAPAAEPKRAAYGTELSEVTSAETPRRATATEHRGIGDQVRTHVQDRTVASSGASNTVVDGASLPLSAGSYRLSAVFGATGLWSKYHTGLDFAAAGGTDVYSVVDGTVVAGSAGGWAGQHVIVRADDGSYTLYAHLSAKTVQVGDRVEAGQHIGDVGSTGRAFGDHLHFEYYPAGTTPGDVYSAGDPLDYLQGLGLQP